MIVIALFLLRRALDPVLPDCYPYLISILAILLTACLFDRGSGFVATAASALLAAYFYLSPMGSFVVERQQDLIGLVLFLIVGATASQIVEDLHRALADVQRAHTDLAQSHAALAQSHADLAQSERARLLLLLLNDFRHRTRNDLNSLVGLLLLRARATPSEAARDGLREAAEHAMALARVHTRLASDGVEDNRIAAVDTHEFVVGLCADLEAALAGEGCGPWRCWRRPRRSGLGTRLLRALAAQLRGSFARHPGPNGGGTIAELRLPAEQAGLRS